MEIRKAREEDMSTILQIYAIAREFMKKNGNPTQWADGYPQESVLRKDLKEENLYVCEEDGVVKGVFSFIMGDDPTYQHIQGGWHRNAAYGAIHRVASDGTLRGLAAQIFSYCQERSSYLRIDTHRDNHPMQHVLRKFGFQDCGIIWAANGSERIAFDLYAK